MAAPYHAFIVNYVAADNFGHHGQIEVADFRIAFGESMKNTIGRLDSWPFLLPGRSTPIDSLILA